MEASEGLIEAFGLARQLFAQLPGNLEQSLDAIEALTQLVWFASSKGAYGPSKHNGTSNSLIGLDG